MLCCFALFVCLTLLASFFLPSHLSFKNMYIHVHAQMHVHVYVVHVYVVHVCCTARMRSNQAETVLFAVAYSLVPQDD